MNAKEFMYNKHNDWEWMEENPDQWDVEYTEKELIAFAEVYAKYKLNNK
jgi:hypothetical protein